MELGTQRLSKVPDLEAQGKPRGGEVGDRAYCWQLHVVSIRLPHLVLLSTLGEDSDSGWCVHGRCILPLKDKEPGVRASNCLLVLRPSKIGLRNIFQISDFSHPTLETSPSLRLSSLIS